MANEKVVAPVKTDVEATHIPTAPAAGCAPHSPLPWRIDAKFNKPRQIEIWSDYPSAFKLKAQVAAVFDDVPRDGRANAAFIVTACNAHHELIEALRQATKALERVERMGVSTGWKERRCIDCRGLYDGDLTPPHQHTAMCRLMRDIASARAALATVAKDSAASLPDAQPVDGGVEIQK